MVVDALLQMYANDSAGTVYARSEYTYHDVVDNDTSDLIDRSELPILAGIKACVATQHSSHVCRAPQAADVDWVEPGIVAAEVPPAGRHFVSSHSK